MGLRKSIVPILGKQKNAEMTAALRGHSSFSTEESARLERMGRKKKKSQKVSLSADFSSHSSDIMEYFQSHYSPVIQKKKKVFKCNM